MIKNVQALRAFAALAIVFYHTDARIMGHHSEYYGVELFFAISGFIMMLVSKSDSWDRFMLKRVTRIVPIYWAFTFLFLLRNYLATHRWDSPSALIRSLLFIPYPDSNGEFHPVVGQGWTLNFEMYFYVFICIGIVLYRPMRGLIAASLILTVIALSHIGALQDNDLVRFYGGYYALYFVMGIGCYYLYTVAETFSGKPEYTGAVWQPVATTACVLMISFYLLWNLLGLHSDNDVPPGFNTTTFVNLLLPPALLTAGLILQLNRAICNIPAIIAAGDASYVIYLCHPLVISPFTYLSIKSARYPWLAPKHNMLIILVILVLTTFVSIFIYRKVELPVLRGLRSLLQFRAQTVR